MKLKAVKKTEPKVEVKRTHTNKKPTRRTLMEEKIKFLEDATGNGMITPQGEKDLAKLKEDLVKSKRGKSSKVKGASYERTIAKKFKDKFDIDLVRTPQSGGFAKKSTKADDFRGDITTVDKDLELKLHIECKDHKTWSATKWIEQAESDCPEGKISTVIAHRGQKVTDGKVTQKSGDYIILSLDDFLDMLNREDIVREKVK